MSTENPGTLANPPDSRLLAMARRPLLAHIEELLIRLRRSLFWVLLGSVGGYLLSNQAMRALEQPLLDRLPAGGHLVFTAPFEKIWVYMRVSLYIGIAFVLPALAWEAAAFAGPGLKRHEKRRIATFVALFTVFFVLGLALGYRYVLPVVIDAAVRFGGGFEQPFLTLSSYINVSIGVLLFSALMLEIPVVMTHLSGWGWIKAESWGRWRRFALVVNAIASAILSPPDAMSMIVMMIPLQLLYESGIWGARVAQWWFYEPSSRRS
ncbi:MAG: twin-arginine translocase subunit TatC [Bdellovibrionales bacterium]|nr:twin-arginine translocase subunit TatC [Bdellovibrionales bacterium]